MTTLMMPSDYGSEMLFGTSPVLGSSFLGGGSPLSNNLFSDYTRIKPSDYSRLPSLWPQKSTTSCSMDHLNTTASSPLDIPNANRFFDRQSLDLPLSQLKRAPSKRGSKRNKKNIALQPTKSCLVHRSDDSEDCLSPESPTSPIREKKRVSFADAQGCQLTQVKLISEASDCPPRWSQDFLHQVTGGAEPEAVGDTWELTFSQPAADYLTWKAKLENDNVAVENVVVNDNGSKINGTIKVRNLSYHKVVAVRYTTTNWSSYDEVEATYIPIQNTAISNSSYCIYDNFSFAIPLPTSSYVDKLEFCVKYSGENFEYWDNNNHRNYVVVCFRSMYRNKNKKPDDVRKVHLDAWGEFACWNHLTLNDSPYY